MYGNHDMVENICRATKARRGVLYPSYLYKGLECLPNEYLSNNWGAL